ncbi:MAG TPA: Gfo/Idh/MocA family oxidoreductase, partial [Verrucomicrobiae bacterium]|nr:Gfo/Idh/MocA family oxidoreductase [Verrucomicrobiae bacterium]
MANMILKNSYFAGTEHKKSPGNSFTRRDFLKASSLAATSFALGGLEISRSAYAAGSDLPKVGLIGCGWYGKSDLCRLIQVSPVEVVSLCDVDQHMLAGAVDLVSQRQKSKKRPAVYNDYREMLAAKKLDIVLVGSPDHWHALHCIAAIESGADVYCQKPISRDVREGQAMLAAARKHQRVVQ